MKTVILCGGLGTRLSEETQVKPKPMVEVGHRPMLWHIMKIYEKYGFSDFVLALGYKGELIKDYFLKYNSYQSDLKIQLKDQIVEYSNPTVEDWCVSMIHTGANSMTGGRLLRLKEYLQPHGTFMLTYGDGVADVNIDKLLKFHRQHGRIATITAVRPSARFGGLQLDDGQVTSFEEKPQSGEGWINGGFFVLEPSVFEYLEDDASVLEQEPMEKLSQDGQLMAYQHRGYWQCMDTIRDRDLLQKAWDSGNPPWWGK